MRSLDVAYLIYAVVIYFGADFALFVIKKKRKEAKEAQRYQEPQHAQPPSKLYNEVMKHQHEMRKQLYREIKLK